MAAARSEEGDSSGAARRIGLLVILRAAEEVFSRHGLGGTSLQMIADVAGLPKSNIGYYFKSKEKLYLEILERVVAQSLNNVEIWITADRTHEEALTGYISAQMSWARVHSDAARILALELATGAPASSDLLNRELKPHIDRVQDVFAVWKNREGLSPVSVPHFLFCIWSMTFGYIAFTPQIEVLLGKRSGMLADQDFNEATRTITGFVLSACSQNSSSLRSLPPTTR